MEGTHPVPSFLRMLKTPVNVLTSLPRRAETVRSRSLKPSTSL